MYSGDTVSSFMHANTHNSKQPQIRNELLMIKRENKCLISIPRVKELINNPRPLSG
jgi:hypothetical protein